MSHYISRTATAGGIALLMGAAFLLPPIAPSVRAAEPQSTGPEVEKMSPTAAKSMEDLPYPVEVSLIHRRTGWLFRASPSNLRLYVNDGDAPDKSDCNGGCSSDRHWSPLIAGKGEMPLGDWTVVTRDDGIRQWAYKGCPAYSRINDSVNSPTGDGVDGVWHFLEP
jgi:predicted lipoprotein with Yx(FWY)xxD motif